MSEWVHLNGALLPYEEATIPVEDRGFLFADGIYEVIRYYRGKPFYLDRHLKRLQASAKAISLPLPYDDQSWQKAIWELLQANQLTDATVYLQVTRGPARRNHLPPENPRPTVLLLARGVPDAAEEQFQQGVTAISLPDHRWHRCDIKSTGLLLNTLAKQQAKEQGAFEALFIRDGVITEGSATNLFAVRSGVLYTHPAGGHILNGITRQLVLELAREEKIPVKEVPQPLAAVQTADEVFLTGSTTEILPVSHIDGVAVAGPVPGPITTKLWQCFRILHQG